MQYVVMVLFADLLTFLMHPSLGWHAYMHSGHSNTDIIDIQDAQENASGFGITHIVEVSVM